MLNVLKDTLKLHDFRSLELEFRIGFEMKTGFHASVPKNLWTHAKDKLGVGEEITTIDRYVTTRYGESSRHVQTPTDTFWEHKKKLASDITAGKFAVRTSIALETREDGKPPNNFVLQRTKHRTSFAKGPWRIDFTRVNTIPIKDDLEETFEIEVELYDVAYLFEKELHLVLDEGIALAQSIVN